MIQIKENQSKRSRAVALVAAVLACVLLASPVCAAAQMADVPLRGGAESLDFSLSLSKKSELSAADLLVGLLRDMGRAETVSEAEKEHSRYSSGLPMRLQHL